MEFIKNQQKKLSKLKAKIQLIRDYNYILTINENCELNQNYVHFPLSNFAKFKIQRIERIILAGKYADFLNLASYENLHEVYKQMEVTFQTGFFEKIYLYLFREWIKRIKSRDTNDVNEHDVPNFQLLI